MLNEIGRYKIDKVLGSGGMATVYLARDPFIERQVAIKLMAHQLAHDEKLRQRFYQEAKVIATLENPNIVKIYDFGEQEGQPYRRLAARPAEPTPRAKPALHPG